MSPFMPFIAFFLIGTTVIKDNKPSDFVYLRNIDSSIIQSVPYCTKQNFIGEKIEGYEGCEVVLTRKAALRLKNVQQEAKKRGYNLVVYNGYCPQTAINQFMRWIKEPNKQQMKDLYYPRIDKSKLFKSNIFDNIYSHARGSAVDVTLINKGITPYNIKVSYRKLNDDSSIPYLDDGTVDMGSSYSFFDIASMQATSLISRQQQENRNLLKKIMEKYGFQSSHKSWWHFIIMDEPYKDQYFDFPIKAYQ